LYRHAELTLAIFILLSNGRKNKTRAASAGFVIDWWAPRESNTAPTDYESRQSNITVYIQ
jgi:hypothetical protein